MYHLGSERWWQQLVPYEASRWILVLVYLFTSTIYIILPVVPVYKTLLLSRSDHHIIHSLHFKIQINTSWPTCSYGLQASLRWSLVLWEWQQESMCLWPLRKTVRRLISRRKKIYKQKVQSKGGQSIMQASISPILSHLEAVPPQILNCLLTVFAHPLIHICAPQTISLPQTGIAGHMRWRSWLRFTSTGV